MERQSVTSKIRRGGETSLMFLLVFLLCGPPWTTRTCTEQCVVQMRK